MNFDDCLSSIELGLSRFDFEGQEVVVWVKTC